MNYLNSRLLTASTSSYRVTRKECVDELIYWSIKLKNLKWYQSKKLCLYKIKYFAEYLDGTV